MFVSPLTQRWINNGGRGPSKNVLWRVGGGGGLYRARERRRSRRMVLITEVIRYLSVYSMFDRKLSHIVVDDGVQTHIEENTAYNDKQELQHTMTYQKIIQANSDIKIPSTKS